MKFYVVTCSDERIKRFKTSSNPLNIEFEIVKSFNATDEVVLRRGKTCFERDTSIPRLTAACLGHMKAMQEIVDSGEDHGVIIEDDVIFHKQFNYVVNVCEQYMIEKPTVGIVTIGFVNFPVGTTVDIYQGIPLIKNVGMGNPWGTQCYMISASYAKKFLSIFQANDDISKCYSDTFSPDWVIFDPMLGCNRTTLYYPYAVESPFEQTIGLVGQSNKPDLFKYLNKDNFYV